MAAKKKKTSKKNTSLLLKTAFLIVIVVFAVSQKDVISESVQNTFGDKTADAEVLKAGAFNIQVFGTTKADKDDVMDILSKVIREYDIIAIEEIRDSSNTSLPKLVDLVNSDGSFYSYFVSERLGRTSSKESYAYIYNKKTVEPIGTPFTYPEAQNTDPFHREPYIGSFKSKEGIFNATFVVIHTDPDEAKEEIDALYEVSEYAKTILPADETVVIMGDFNADGSYFDEDSYTPMKSEGYTWVIGNSVDTTTGTTDCTYDRIVLTGGNDFYTGNAGVVRFDTEYSLTEEFTKQVSDHYPVYALFSKGASGSNTGILDLAAQVISNIDNSSTADENNSTTSKLSETIQVTALDVLENQVKIANTGSVSADIGNYRLISSKTGNSYVFPAGTLIPAYGIITLSCGFEDNIGYELYWNCVDDVWDDTGDAAKLYNSSGELIDTIVS